MVAMVAMVATAATVMADMADGETTIITTTLDGNPSQLNHLLIRI